MKAVTDSFYGKEVGLPLLLLISSWSDQLAPYCFYTLGLCSLLISVLG